MVEHADELDWWDGRELFDARGEKIGVIAGLGFPRKRFGTLWLLVEITSERKVLVPAEQIRCSDPRLVLPYSRSYIESAPAFDPERPLTSDEERTLRLRYGIGSGSPNTGCSAGCGLCLAGTRLERREKSG